MAFLDGIINGMPRPSYAWQIERDGSIRVRTATKPIHARLWHAVNPHARDFRFQTIGRAFWASDLQDSGGLTFIGNVPIPTQGYAAYFVELAYATSRNDVFTVTTGVRITPDVLPYGWPPLRH
jgi:PhoPQ-activated pathogenicity-related protein